MQEIIIYGAGRTGKAVWEVCCRCGINVVAFIDRMTAGEFCGISVVRADMIPVDTDRTLPVVLALHDDVHNAAVAVKNAGFENVMTLSAFNIYLRRNSVAAVELVPLFDPEIFSGSCDEIAAAGAVLADERSHIILDNYLEYLKTGQLDKLEKHEPGVMYYPENRPFEFFGKVTMADCGSYIGDTIMSLMPYIEFEKIYAFDPDPLVASQLRENLSRYKGLDFHIIQAGLGSCRGQIAFAEDGTGRGVIREDGGIKIDIVTLDEVFSNVKVDFIKMDIEGAEADALLGAANVIKRDMPLLEVSVYHRPGDFWKLPLLIKELNPEYSIYLRCGNDSFHDTVAVAVPERFKLR